MQAPRLRLALHPRPYCRLRQQQVHLRTHRHRNTETDRHTHTHTHIPSRSWLSSHHLSSPRIGCTLQLADFSGCLENDFRTRVFRNWQYQFGVFRMFTRSDVSLTSLQVRPGDQPGYPPISRVASLAVSGPLPPAFRMKIVYMREKLP